MKRISWLRVMLCQPSRHVGMGRELGRARGALGKGSRKIWCETLLCLYLWPRRCPTFCFDISYSSVRDLDKRLTDLATGEVERDVGWNLNTPLAFSVKTLPELPALSKGLYCEEEFVSVELSGAEGGAPDGGGNAGAAPYLPMGKFSSMGERELGSKVDLAGELR